MRDMRKITEEQNFIDSRNSFIKKFKDNDKCQNETNCEWKIFKQSFLKFAKYKCPICEHTLTNYDDIDHFRPKGEGYEFLRCCCDNYMIMCTECNRKFKKTSFPLKDRFKATKREEIYKEKPLLVNPMIDNVLDFFEIHFLRSGENLLLEIHPNSSLNEQSFEYLKAEKTIETYGIGSCSTNAKIDGCRINILEEHYEKFIDLAKAREISLKKFLSMLKDTPKKQEYDFIKFIFNNQFKILN